MANNNDIIKHSDIAESGAVKPLMEEFIALLNVLKEVDSSVVKLAKDLKVTLKSSSPDSLGGINKLAGATDAANKAYDVRAKTLREQRMLESQLVETMEDAVKVNMALRVEVENANKVTKENAKLTSTTVTAYEKAVIQLNRMAKNLKDLSIQGRTNTQQFKDLKKTYDDLFVSVSKAEQMVGQHQRNVGNYESGFRNLQHSINQVTRELPAFTNSVQTGFMAISNNIPMLVDQMKALSEQNKILKANGEATVPVWRQMVKGIVSWQSALSIGITLLTVYSKEIWAGVRSLFGYEDAAKKAEEAQKAFNESIAEGQRRSSNFRDEFISDIEFQTRAQVAAARKRGASEQEIRAIEDKGRQDAIKKQEKFVNDLVFLSSEAFMKIADLEDKIRKAQSGGVFGVGNDDEAIETFKKQLEETKQLYEKQLRDREEADKELIRMKREANFALRSQEADDAAKARENSKKADEEAKKEAEKRYKEALEAEERARRELEAYEAWLNDPSRASKAAERMTTEIKEQLANSVRVTYQDYRKAVDKGYKETRDKDQKNEEKLAKDRQKFLQDQLTTLERFTQRENDIKSQQISDEINATQKRQDQLRDLAAKGSLDAQNSLALEERKRAELEAKRLRNLKAQKREELIFAGIKAYAANVEKNPQGAFLQTSKDLVKLTSLLSNLPSFKKGTENTGKVVGGIDGEGGMLSILHPEERVLTKEQNKLIGDFTNEELANLAFTARVGQVDDTLVFETRRVAKKIDKLAQAIENKPTQYFSVDEVEKLVHTTIETKHSKTTNTRRIGKYGF